MAQILATGQSYQQDGRMLTRADLPEIQKTIDWLERRIEAAAPTGPSETKINLKRPL